MKFTGKELFDIGCPQKIIKFFINKEFDNLEHLKSEIENFSLTDLKKSEEDKEVDKIIQTDPECAFNFLWNLGVFPWSIITQSLQPSKRELRQWLKDRAIRVNGSFPSVTDKLSFPITDLCFFPGAKRQTTVF